MDKKLIDICIWGDYDKLIDYNFIDKAHAESAFNCMNCKLMDIDVWKTEDNNQSDDRQKSLYDREVNIKKCIQYLIKIYKINQMIYQMNSDDY